MFYGVLSPRDINRAFKRYICKCTNIISLAVSFVPCCYGWWGWDESRRDEAAPMIILIVHRLIKPCVCVFLFEHCTKLKNAFAPDMCYVLLPPPAQGIWDSMLMSMANPHLQLLSTQRQELILIPLLWAGRSVACLLSPPKSLWTDGALWLGKLKEGGVSGDRNSRSSLGVFFFPPNKQLASLLPPFELLRLLVSPHCHVLCCHQWDPVTVSLPEENPVIMLRGTWPGPWNSYGINTCCETGGGNILAPWACTGVFTCKVCFGKTQQSNKPNAFQEKTKSHCSHL